MLTYVNLSSLSSTIGTKKYYVSVLKETYVEIKWERSADDVYGNFNGKFTYSVDCFRCNRKYKGCNDSCGLRVRYAPSKDNISAGTTGTVTIHGLPSGSFLIFRVYSVYNLNKHLKDRDKWSYDAVLVETKGK